MSNESGWQIEYKCLLRQGTGGWWRDASGIDEEISYWGLFSVGFKWIWLAAGECNWAKLWQQQWLSFPFLKLKGGFIWLWNSLHFILMPLQTYISIRLSIIYFLWWSAEELNCGVSQPEEVLRSYDSSSPTSCNLIAQTHLDKSILHFHK